MRKTSISYTAAFAIACAILPAQADAKNQKSWATASSIGVYSLTAIALGVPLLKADTKGALQAGGSVAAAQLVTFGLKEVFPERRPDGSDRKSFPSGHTSMAFAAAATLYNREGASFGIPAFAVATFVGVARVKADKHHWYDCVAGAGIGLASGLLITHEPHQHIGMVPWGDTKGGGVALAVQF